MFVTKKKYEQLLKQYNTAMAENLNLGGMLKDRDEVTIELFANPKDLKQKTVEKQGYILLKLSSAKLNQLIYTLKRKHYNELFVMFLVGIKNRLSIYTNPIASKDKILYITKELVDNMPDDREYRVSYKNMLGNFARALSVAAPDRGFVLLAELLYDFKKQMRIVFNSPTQTIYMSRDTIRNYLVILDKSLTKEIVEALKDDIVYYVIKEALG